ncbi:MAG: Flp pilus assembly complex ATPase component TadA [Candidatus Omnitrophica bacterium]|nr:Flp pilus assembly complex ATPase component TadA [Candidatus Omnitrophota bacterium]
MVKHNDKILADELVKATLLSQAKADQLLVELQSSGEPLHAYLIRQGIVPERQVLEKLASVHQLSFLDLKSMTIDKNVVEKIPVRFATYFKFMPIKIEGRVLTVATANPLDIKFQDEIRVHLGLEPKVVLVRDADIAEALNKYYGLAANTLDKLSKDTKKTTADESPAAWVEDLETNANDASVSKLVNEILLEAHKKRATDIHIEPYRNKVRVRYRIDGLLLDANIPPGVKPFLLSIISRIKLMANLSIVEKRLPQDGSAIVKTREQDLDLRVSTIPTPRGESMVIRILPTNITLLSLERLGLEERNLRLFRELIQKPHGIILVTGPTGSGKTTTLYACLNELNTADRKIITLEDPLEYELEGITQIQVNSKVNLDFAAGLRSVLRHDPDIIMVGEIRDVETAEIAIRTALTGHLVFSTLHTNDAASGVTRLIEMGLEPFLVSSSIEAFIAQRLVRIICSHCKEEVISGLDDVRQEIAATFKMDVKAVKIYKGRGCDYCNGTGYYGRSAIYEILVMNEEIRGGILGKVRADVIKKLAMKNGMTTLRQDGWRKVLEGITTVSEVMEIAVKDENWDASDVPDAAGLSSVSASEIPHFVLREITPEILKVKDDYNSRTYSRVEARVGIRYQVVEQDDNDMTHLTTDGVEHSSITKDVSAGGVRFVTGYTLPLGTILQLKIQLEKGEKSIDCLGKICRVEEDSVSAMFNLAAYYLDISSADRVRLDNYARAKLVGNNSSQGDS